MPNLLRQFFGPYRVALLAGAALVGSWSHATVHADPPTPNKIVIVINENRSLHAVLGSGEAPYLDSLAAGGAHFTNMFALTHPSQPNYLQLFSGSKQGVVANVQVENAPLSAPNLGAAVIAAGGTFAGYSESMPYAGYKDWDANEGLYARRHNPWVNWQADAP